MTEQIGDFWSTDTYKAETMLEDILYPICDCMYRNMSIPAICQSSVYPCILQKSSEHLGTFLQLGPRSLWWYGYQPALQHVFNIRIPWCVCPAVTIVNIPICSLWILPCCFPSDPLLSSTDCHFWQHSWIYCWLAAPVTTSPEHH